MALVSAIDVTGVSAAPDAGEDLRSRDRRLRELLANHFEVVWRALRRFGLPPDRADDAAQTVFLVASRKLASIMPGSERSFLLGTAVRVASDVRRSAAFRREVPYEDPAHDLVAPQGPDELVEQRRARDMLDEVLEGLDEELRTVFVFFELEQMSTAEIAEVLGIPSGTVASRLRRAREIFEKRVAVRLAGRPR